MRKRILVIDDDLDNRVRLWNRLDAMGFDVITERNGRAGLSCIEQERDRASIVGVLLELFVPGLDGVAVLGELRRCRPDLPVIVMGPAIRSSELQSAIMKGASDCLAKPFSVETVTDKCRSLFSKRARLSATVLLPPAGRRPGAGPGSSGLQEAR
jgi:DNA-binding NtrC family response regulator